MNKEKEDSEISSDDDGTDSEGSLCEIDIWKAPKKDRGPAASNLDVPSSSALFQKKFKEHRFAQEDEAKKALDIKQRRNAKRRLRRKRKVAAKEAKKEQSSSEMSIKVSDDETKWQEVRPFMGVYDHIHGPVGHGKYGPKTELEHEIDDALEKDDFKKAELLSDKLSAREFGVKVSRAFAAKRAWEKKTVEDQEKILKKKKRLTWGFEAKERWEMKGNM